MDLMIDLEKRFSDALSEHREGLLKMENLNEIERSIKLGQVENVLNTWKITEEKIHYFYGEEDRFFIDLFAEYFIFALNRQIQEVEKRQKSERRQGNIADSEKYGVERQTLKFLLNKFKRIFREIVGDLKRPLFREAI